MPSLGVFAATSHWNVSLSQPYNQLISPERAVYGFMSKRSTCMHVLLLATLNGWTWCANKNRGGIYMLVLLFLLIYCFFPIEKLVVNQLILLDIVSDACSLMR